ncbi:hypothetical protein bcgnr5390_17890 [Bacillus luti]|nr:hypothetical protein BC2903_62060 [Bacillus cereus]
MTNNINLMKKNENTEEKGVLAKLKNVTSGVVKGGAIVKTIMVGAAQGVSSEIQKSKMNQEELELEAKILRDRKVASNMNGKVRMYKNEIRNAANVGCATFFPNEEENIVGKDKLLREAELTKNNDTGMGFYELKRTIEGFTFQVIFESFETVVIDDNGENTDRFLVMPGGEHVNARDVHEPRSILYLYARDNRGIPNDEKLFGGDSFLLGYGDNKMKTHPILKKELIESGKKDQVIKLFDLFDRSMEELKAETSTRLFRNPEERRREEQHMRTIQDEERRKAEAERIAAEKEHDAEKTALMIRSAVQDVLKELPQQYQPGVQQQPFVQPQYPAVEQQYQPAQQQQPFVQPQHPAVEQPTVENQLANPSVSKFVTVMVNGHLFSEGSIYVDAVNVIVNQVSYPKDTVVTIDDVQFIGGMININDNIVSQNGLVIGRAVLPSMLKHPMSPNDNHGAGQLAQ